MALYTRRLRPAAGSAGWAGILLVAISGAVAAEPAPPSIRLPLMKAAPTIDGVIDEQQWRDAVRHVGFISRITGAATDRQGVFWIGCDGKNLLLAVKTEAPPDQRLLTRAVPDPDRDVVAAFHDDSLEFVLAPEGDRFFHLITNARGALYDWAVEPGNRQNPTQLAWRLPQWEFQQRLADGWWQAEIAIPLASLGITADSILGETWGVQVARNWRRPSEQSQWSAGPAAYDNRSSLPQITWDETAPVVHVLSLASDGKPRIEIAVYNPHGHPVEVATLLADAWHRDPPQEAKQTATIGPAEEKTFSLTGRDGGPEGRHETTIRVTSPDGGRVYYDRTQQWSLHRPESPWAVGDEQKQDIALQFKYYPSTSRIHFRAGVEALAFRDRVSGGRAAIWKAGGGGERIEPALWQQSLKLRDYATESTCEIPSLGVGNYLFGIQLEGGDGVPKEPLLEPFVRQVFEWEGNTLGISDEVMPPFTPLEVAGTTVKAVLRQHRHGPAGLWDGVTSDGKELLAGPMRWEVVGEDSDGQPKPYTITAEPWRATSQKPAAVVGQSSWSAGPLRAEVATEYEYDGMMLVTLALEPTEQPIRRLSLAVPLADKTARYMHAVGDGLRHNYAGFTPTGEGRVWDSSQANRLEIPGTFFPYLWLGDGERGICWFADTDRDWILDDQTPAIDLSREGGELTMRVHFITKPGRLERPHRIVFGLQATPTKPMPEGWRRWVGRTGIDGTRPVRWLGSNFYWGSLAYDEYPYQYRFDFYDKLKETRRTGEIDQEYIDRWMAMWGKELSPEGTERYEFLQRHVRAGFWGAKGAPWSDGVRLFVYTNPRGVGFHVPEFATFQDEWLRYRFYNRNWGKENAVGYDVSPSRSFQDYALWCYRKMLTCFDGVYWDNMFLSANFDPVVGEAWTDEAGRVHPTLGLMHMRNLAKRTAVMLWHETKDFPEGRKPPVTLVHMTNAMLAPVFSFINCTMDWEWKYGYDDFQDRFSPDLTVAETIGRQVGAWPTILAGGHPDGDDPRVDFMYRTRLGVTLVHEVQVFDYRPERDREMYGKLYEFGYGSDACRVFNYWQDDHPVRVAGTDARTLALANAGAAIVVVTDYGEGGDCRVMLDLARLGLKPEASATNLETGEPIGRSAPGVFTLPMNKHDFCILRVQ
ncbi:MAG: hypothetical protein GXY83_21250 [Rhodopirellula sp.]|nr:hypothetical protein [Rhodopirellula sp.]